MNTQDLKQIANNQLEIINLQVQLLQCLYSLNHDTACKRDIIGG